MDGLKRDWFGLVEFSPGEARTRGGGFLYLLEEVGSTSDFLLGRGEPATGRLCRWDGWGWQAGEKQLLQPPREVRRGSMAVARRQVDGRGRRGHRWHGGRGLMMSWLLETGDADVEPGLSVWVGLICAIALRGPTGEPIGLKWPNDLRLRGCKLGGLIVDNVQQTVGARIVAGLGLNIGDLPRDMPEDVRAAAVSLKPASWPGRTLSALAGAIIGSCDGWLPSFLTEGWRGFAAQFAELDETRGKRIRLTSAEGILEGVADGLDQHGALRLRHDDGSITPLIVGDVHILGLGED